MIGIWVLFISWSVNLTTYSSLKVVKIEMSGSPKGEERDTCQNIHARKKFSENGKSRCVLLCQYEHHLCAYFSERKGLVLIVSTNLPFSPWRLSYLLWTTVNSYTSPCSCDIIWFISFGNLQCSKKFNKIFFLIELVSDLKCLKLLTC